VDYPAHILFDFFIIFTIEYVYPTHPAFPVIGLSLSKFRLIYFVGLCIEMFLHYLLKLIVDPGK